MVDCAKAGENARARPIFDICDLVLRSLFLNSDSKSITLIKLRVRFRKFDEQTL